MVFFKGLFKGITMSTEELIDETNEFIAESNKEMATIIKEKEGLDYLKIIATNDTFGIEDEYGDKFHLKLFKDRLRFDAQFSKKSRDILFSNITSIKVLTDIQIEEQSKIGQIMVIGLYALATKPKTTEVVSKRVVVNVCEDDIDFSVIIDTVHDALAVAKEIKKAMNSNLSVEQ